MFSKTFLWFINLAKEDVVFVKNIFKLLIFERENLRELYDVVIIILVTYIILMKEIILNLLNVSMKICNENIKSRYTYD